MLILWLKNFKAVSRRLDGCSERYRDFAQGFVRVLLGFRVYLQAPKGSLLGLPYRILNINHKKGTTMEPMGSGQFSFAGFAVWVHCAFYRVMQVPCSRSIASGRRVLQND